MAKRGSSLSISLLLPFPDESSDCDATSPETSAGYMHCEVDEGEMQNVDNAYMSARAFAIVAQDALALRDRARVGVISRPVARTLLPTVANLLAAIATRPEWAKHALMLRTRLPIEGDLGRCRFGAQFTGSPNQQPQIIDVRPHGITLVAAILQVVFELAHQGGSWSPGTRSAGCPSISPRWPAAIYAAAKACKCGSVVRFAVERGIEPGALGGEELEHWADAYMASGHSYSRTTVVKHLFRKAIFDAGLNLLMPELSRRKRSTYGIPIRLFPPALRAEVEAKMRYKQAEFVADAKGKRTKLRPESARTVTQALGRIYGYGMAHGPQINSLDDLVSRAVITAYADFCINERKLRPNPVRCALGAVRAAYAQFRGVDLPWFRTLLMSMPHESDKTIVRRKAGALRLLQHFSEH